MSAPRGLGWWVAFERAITDGPKKDDVQHAIEICKATGASWICVRASAGGNDDADLNAESVAAYATAGLQVVIWIFDYAKSEVAELVDFQRYYDLGVRACVLNAEYEYLAANAAQARGLVEKLRAMGYEWVAHAPPAYAGARGDGPLKELDVDCDAILPQVYAYEISDQGHVHHITAVMKLYAGRGYGPDKVWPILGPYRPRTRGYFDNDVKRPIPIPPMAHEAEKVAADTVLGLEELDRIGVKNGSLYTIDALHFIGRTYDPKGIVLDAITEYARPKHEPAPTLPEGAATPITWADRAEAEAERDATDPNASPDGKKKEERRSSSSQKLKAVMLEDDEPETPKGGAA